MKVYLIRHGKTAANEQRLYCGQTDVPLSEDGIQELKNKKSIFKYPDVKDLDVYTSGLLRTEQTLTVLFGDILHKTVPGLMEINFGAFEMKSYEMLKDDEAYIQWCSGDNEANIPPGEGAESGYQMRDRALSAFKEILEEGKDCLIVSHGGPITALYQAYNALDSSTWYDIQPKNGEGFLLEFEDGRFKGANFIPEK